MARPRQFDPEHTLDFAVDTFWECGFEATSIEKLCRNLKLNPGSLYGAYGDKRTLFIAILDRYIDKVSSEAIERIAGNPSGVAGIRAYFDFLIEGYPRGKAAMGLPSDQFARRAVGPRAGSVGQGRAPFRSP